MIRYRLRTAERKPFARPDWLDKTLYALLVQRGIDSEEAARRYLNPGRDDLYDPMLLNDMDRAVSRIRSALRNHESICVYGDYDVDGVSASAILSSYLRSQGGDVQVYIPSRHREGYGLNEPAVREIAAGCDLMVTVDCGITSVALVALAKDLGLDVIVTDHHQMGETLPDCPVINPLLNDYPFPYLCGAGVAFKLVDALGGRDAAMEYVDIAALATVADVVTLQDENRAIVRMGLDRINTDPRPGLRALIESASLQGKRISAGNIGFQLAPRLNAGGRLGSATRSYDLIMSRTMEEAVPIALELEAENADRRKIETKILNDAEAQLADFDFPNHRIIILSGEDWNPGVIGLTASRLVEKYHYPVILLARNGDTMTGSCRSIPGVNIYESLCAVSDTMIRFGGHRQAAGLTVESARFDEFRSSLDDYLKKTVSPACWIPDQEYDMILPLDELTPDFVTALDMLQPTGFGNPAPVFRAQPHVLGARRVGLDGAHLQLQLSENGAHRQGIFFRAGGMYDDLPEDLDILYSPELNEFRGRVSVQLALKSLKSSSVLTRIDAKIAEEDDLQREFLTDMLYNNIIDFPFPNETALTQDALREMLACPQGTVIMAGDFDIAKKIIDLAGEAPLDLYIRKLPDDRRAFNAVCVYPVRGLLPPYHNLVLAGFPQGILNHPNAKIFRMDARAGWMDELPDLDALRACYVAVRRMAKEPASWYHAPAMTEAVAKQAGLSYVSAAACMLALCDMQLIEMDLNSVPTRITMLPKRKLDPQTSIVWRTLQSWRARPE